MGRIWGILLFSVFSRFSLLLPFLSSTLEERNSHSFRSSMQWKKNPYSVSVLCRQCGRKPGLLLWVPPCPTLHMQEQAGVHGQCLSTACFQHSLAKAQLGLPGYTAAGKAVLQGHFRFLFSPASPFCFSWSANYHQSRHSSNSSLPAQWLRTPGFPGQALQQASARPWARHSTGASAPSPQSVQQCRPVPTSYSLGLWVLPGENWLFCEYSPCTAGSDLCCSHYALPLSKLIEIISAS